MRGEHRRVTRRRDLSTGITPACAGSTWPPRGGLDDTDHPRMRGEHKTSSSISTTALGSPPHARGARGAAVHGILLSGITPACAGSTTEVGDITYNNGDHPRMRGEHTGLDPLLVVPVGITPACAGSTCPRSNAPVFGFGSPPHARGARALARGQPDRLRITPACAGSTSSPTTWSSIAADHPRMRGEHIGLGGDVLLKTRITPACAGSTGAGRRASRPATGSPPHARGAPVGTVAAD